MKVKFKKLVSDAIVPTYAHDGDAGADLYSVDDEVLFNQGDIMVINTGIAVEIPYGYVGYINSRSGLASKGIAVLNAPGTIDCGYTGELKVILINHGKPKYILKGDKIAQLVIHKIEYADFEEADELSNTQRNTQGFGSTGQ